MKPEEGWATEHPYFKRGQCSPKMIGNHCSINGVRIHLGSTYVWHQLLGLICMVMGQDWRQLEDTGRKLVQDRVEPCLGRFCSPW